MTTSSYIYKLVSSASEYGAYCELRQMIFAEEQGLFESDDEDHWDAIAYPIVALNASKQVVGVVRIYEIEPETWYGGRLGVHPDYRRVGQIGRGLIYKAVTTANTWGCRQFLATVQLQNVKFFRRQHWHSLEEMVICDRPHHLMQADLEYYPPSDEPRPTIGYWTGVRELEAS